MLGVASDSDDDEVEEYERRLRKFQSKGFKDELASDVEEEEQKGMLALGLKTNAEYLLMVFDVHSVFLLKFM